MPIKTKPQRLSQMNIRVDDYKTNNFEYSFEIDAFDD